MIGTILLEGLSDPRIDPARVSVTRVEVSPDMAYAKVYISVMGTESEQRNAQRALTHAAGRIQNRMMDQIRLRVTPQLTFVPDVQFKKSLATLTLIQQAMEELRQREPQPPEDAEDTDTQGGPEDADEAGDEDAPPAS